MNNFDSEVDLRLGTLVTSKSTYDYFPTQSRRCRQNENRRATLNGLNTDLNEHF